MATSAQLTIYNKNDEPICRLYFHYDGYIDGVGKEIVDFLEEREYVTSLAAQSKPSSNFCNETEDMEDLAAQIVCHFKNLHPVGNVYLYPVNQDIYTDYAYFLKAQKGLELIAIHQNTMTKLFPVKKEQ